MMTGRGGCEMLCGRPKSGTLNADLKKAESALIMLHRHDLIQVKLATRWFQKLQYQPLVIDRPVEFEKPAASIKRLDAFRSLYFNKAISVVALELNYATIRGANPNFELIRHILQHVRPKVLFLTTATDDCIENFKQFVELNRLADSPDKLNLDNVFVLGVYDFHPSNIELILKTREAYINPKKLSLQPSHEVETCSDMLTLGK